MQMVHVILNPPDPAGGEEPTAGLDMLRDSIERLGIAGHIRVDAVGPDVVVTLFIAAKTIALAEYRAAAACRGVISGDARFAGWRVLDCVPGFPDSVYENLEDWE